MQILKRQELSLNTVHGFCGFSFLRMFILFVSMFTPFNYHTNFGLFLFPYEKECDFLSKVNLLKNFHS